MLCINCSSLNVLANDRAIKEERQEEKKVEQNKRRGRKKSISSRKKKPFDALIKAVSYKSYVITIVQLTKNLSEFHNVLLLIKTVNVIFFPSFINKLHDDATHRRFPLNDKKDRTLFYVSELTFVVRLIATAMILQKFLAVTIFLVFRQAWLTVCWSCEITFSHASKTITRLFLRNFMVLIVFNIRFSFVWLLVFVCVVWVIAIDRTWSECSAQITEQKDE